MHVGTGAHAQHVQCHELGGVLQGRCPFGRDVAVHRRPDRAEHLVPGTDSDRHPLLADAVGAEPGRIDDHRAVRPVEIAEDPELRQHPGVLLRDLAADDRLDPRRVRLVLSSREGEHPRAAVLDGDGSIEEGSHRVGHGEQVTGREAAERLGLGRADVALGEERAQQRGQLGPGRAATQAEERRASRLDRPGEVRRHHHGRADDESDRTATPQVAHEAGEVGGRHADAEDERARWVHGFVVGVVDDDATDVSLVVRVARDQLEHGVAQVVEDPPQARPRPLAHGSQDRWEGHGSEVQSGIHSVEVVTDPRTSGIGVTPSPGPVGTAMWPSSRTSGSVMSVA